MLPYSQSNIFASAGENRTRKKPPNKEYNESPNSSPYFSRLFSSPILRNTVLSSSSPLVSPRQSAAAPNDLPPSLFNFQSPIRLRPTYKPQPCLPPPRNATDFLNHTTSSMMERALRVLESKRNKRSNESLNEDLHTSEQATVKRYRISEKNNNHLLSRSVTMLPQEFEVTSRPRLTPSISSTRPSSTKLPDHVSRLSSATLEAIAFGIKRQWPNEDEESASLPRRINDAVSLLDENFLSPSAPPTAKRRITRDCETQTVLQVDSSTTTSESSLPPTPAHQKHTLSSARPTSVSRFITGLEARARANALSRHLTVSSATALTLANSLEARHANIRRMFADLTEKSSVSRADDVSVLTAASATGANVTTSTNAGIVNSPQFSYEPAITVVTTTATESGTASCVVASTTASTPATETVIEPMSSVASTSTLPLGKALVVSEQESANTPLSVITSTVNSPNFAFNFEVKSMTSTEGITTSSTSVTPVLTSPVGLPLQMSTEQTTSLTTAPTCANSVVKSTLTIFKHPEFTGTTSSTVSSTSSPAVPGFAFSPTKATTSEVNTTNSKSSVPMVSTAVPFAPPATKSTSLLSLDFSSKDKSNPSSAKLFDFSAVSADSTSTTVSSTAKGGSLAPTAAQSSLSCPSFMSANAAPTTGSESMFNFSAQPSSIATTVSTIGASTFASPVFNFSAKSDATKMSVVFPAVSTLAPAKSVSALVFAPVATTTPIPPLFDFSKTSTDARSGGSAASAFTFSSSIPATTAPPSSFLISSVASKSDTTTPFNFPAPKNATTTIASVSPFDIVKTATSGLTNGRGPFGPTPLTFLNSSNSSAITSNSGGFIFNLPTQNSAATTTAPAPFNFFNPATNLSSLGAGAMGAINFSVGSNPTGPTPTPFAPNPAAGIFQFSSEKTAAPDTTTTTSLGFPLPLLSTKSSPSIFSVGDDTKRTGDSVFGASVVNHSTLSGASAQPFNLGGTNLTAAPDNSGGFNFSVSTGNSMAFNFGQTSQLAPAFSGPGAGPPNPFSATTPSAPNATASLQQRRRQMRFSRRR